MRDAAIEKRIFLRRFLVHVRVERVACELGKVIDVVHRHLARVRVHGVADLQFLKSLAEGVALGLGSVSTADPAVADGGKSLRRTLNRCALHVVQDAADAAQFLTAAGPPGAAVHEMRQG